MDPYPKYRLYITSKHFTVTLIQFQSLAEGISSQLVMDRNSGRCENKANFDPTMFCEASRLSLVETYALVGIISIESKAFLLCVTEASVVGMIDEAEIYVIKAVVAIPFDAQTCKTDSIVRVINNITKFMSTGFYFSYRYDLTNTRQRGYI